jgi:hypothetical protein
MIAQFFRPASMTALSAAIRAKLTRSEERYPVHKAKSPNAEHNEL